MNVILAKAVAFEEALRPKFRTYAKQVLKNANRLAQQLMSKGFKLVTNGTDNHLILIDMISSFNVGGREAEELYDSTLNKNVIPNDIRNPFDPSGIRLGTPAITTRGMKEKDMDVIADWMHKAVTHRHNSKYLRSLKSEIIKYCEKFPLPGDF